MNRTEEAYPKRVKCPLLAQCTSHSCSMRKTQRSQRIGQWFENPFLEGVRGAPTVPATAKRCRAEDVDVNKSHQNALGIRRESQWCRIVASFADTG